MTTVGKMDPKFKARLDDPLVRELAKPWYPDEEFIRNWNADPERDGRLYDTLWVLDNLKRLGYQIEGPLSVMKAKIKKRY